jgi:hypothetical protein
MYTWNMFYDTSTLPKFVALVISIVVAATFSKSWKSLYDIWIHQGLSAQRVGGRCKNFRIHKAYVLRSGTTSILYIHTVS